LSVGDIMSVPAIYVNERLPASYFLLPQFFAPILSLTLPHTPFPSPSSFVVYLIQGLAYDNSNGYLCLKENNDYSLIKLFPLAFVSQFKFSKTNILSFLLQFTNVSALLIISDNGWSR
jgi:hypothetical protein